ncbi:MAG TPA: hypothetical protein PL182_11390, partial [Pseudobdellovibrionaceae bacterium]|nr:hypothetical protein [Pseudobdellovibrionaceae bacterium]
RQNLFSMNPIEGKWALSKATRAGIEVRSGDKGFRDAGHFVLTTAGRILGLKAPRGIRRLEIHDAENPEGSPLAQSPLQVRLRQITRWVPVNESDTHLDFLLQSGDEIQAHRIFCPGGINRPSK